MNRWRLRVAFLAFAQDPFAADVRPTPWLAPAQEQAQLHVPDGFQVTCFVQEPQIWKPMNLAFDARGRLWCTSSTEYPVPVGPDRGFTGRDKLTFHEDRDGDGVAETTIVFAEDLNVPIGLLPVVDEAGHDGCVVFSVPNIWRLDDLDGDGRADRRTLLYGPMGWQRDAHGLNNSFRRGADGWIYACHGYNNITDVKGRDGVSMHLESGNTYRFKLDGSHIEKFTQGQVNPFGSAFDERGDLFTADCHTLPITMLLQGACYESFGAPHDGLGFAPQVMKHLHGSTALCGLAIETGGAFPPQYSGDLFVGNVMSGRVHRDHLEWHGSTPMAVEQPDLVVSDDPWFRPVDLQIGPDGALYVADFYNRIIGHYEVPLDHPGRDRTSGRIWRIAPPGGDASSLRLDLRRADVDGLIARFDDRNLGVRMRALDELTDRLGDEFATEAVVTALRAWHIERAAAANASPPSPQRATMLMWALFRLAPSDLVRLADELPLLPKWTALQAFAEIAVVEGVHSRGLFGRASGGSLAVPRDSRDFIASLRDADPFVVRAAAHALQRLPTLAALGPLIDAFARVSVDDPMLRHALKLALRAHLDLPGALDRVDDLSPDAATRAAVVELALALHGEAAGRFLIEQALKLTDRARITPLLEHAAREAAPRDLPRLVAAVQARFGDERATQLALLQAMLQGLEARGGTPIPALSGWAEALIAPALVQREARAPAWRNEAVAGAGKSANPWCLQVRRSADGVEAPFLSSLPRGEARTGALRSPPFEAPSTLAFWIAGHNGETDRAAIPFNKVRVVDAEDARLLAELLAPRNDLAQRVELDLAAAAGRAVVLEVIDANPYDAYAWIALGRFEPAVVAMPERSPAETSDELVAACDVARRFRDGSLEAPLAALLRSPLAEPRVRAAAAAALLASARGPSWPTVASALAELLDDPDAPRELIEPIAAGLADFAAPSAPGVAPDESLLADVAARAVELCPSRQQLAIAVAWARAPEGAQRLIELVEQGKAARALLAKPACRDALVASLPQDGAARIEALTKGLASEDEARVKLLAARKKSFARFGGDAAIGAQLFTRNCASCHAIGGIGATIGPQLDGVRLRGFERVLEDLLDPNRNVDPQFARTNLFLKSGDVLSVLVRRREAKVLVYVDERGAEQTLPLAALDQERPSRFSLMPDNFGDLLDDAAVRDLLAWLLMARK